MNKYPAATLVALLLLAACTSEQAAQTETRTSTDAPAAFAALLDEHFERVLELNPMSATSIGDYRYNDRYANSIGSEHRAATRELNEEFLTRLLEIDRGALEDTVLEEGVRLDNQIQVAHNVHIGAHTAIAGCVGISGSAHIGRHCLIGGGAGIVGHLEITDNVVITGMTMVTRSITQPGVYSSGVPAQDNDSWNRNYARFRQLDKLARKVQRLEKLATTADSLGSKRAGENE